MLAPWLTTYLALSCTARRPVVTWCSTLRPCSPCRGPAGSGQPRSPRSSPYSRTHRGPARTPPEATYRTDGNPGTVGETVRNRSDTFLTLYFFHLYLSIYLSIYLFIYLYLYQIHSLRLDYGGLGPFCSTHANIYIYIYNVYLFL